MTKALQIKTDDSQDLDSSLGGIENSVLSENFEADIEKSEGFRARLNILLNLEDAIQGSDIRYSQLPRDKKEFLLDSIIFGKKQGKFLKDRGGESIGNKVSGCNTISSAYDYEEGDITDEEKEILFRICVNKLDSEEALNSNQAKESAFRGRLNILLNLEDAIQGSDIEYSQLPRDKKEFLLDSIIFGKKQGKFLKDRGGESIGNKVSRCNTISSAYDYEEGGISDEEKIQLSGISEILFSDNYTESCKNAFLNYLRDSSRQNEEKLVAIMADQSIPQDRVLEVGGDIGRTLKIFKIQSDFDTLLGSYNNVNELFDFLKDQQIDTTEEQELVNTLFGYAFDERLRVFMKSFISGLNPEDIDFETAYQDLKTFATKGKENDIIFASLYAQTLYLLEYAMIEQEAWALINEDITHDNIKAFIEKQPSRPKVGDVDQFAMIQKLKEDLLGVVPIFNQNALLRDALGVQNSFGSKPYNEIVGGIEGLAMKYPDIVGSTPGIIFNRLREFTARDGSDIFDSELQPQIQAKVSKALEDRFPRVGEGKNEDARDYLRENFGSTIYVLYESLKGNPAISDDIKKYVTGKDQDGESIFLRYRQSVAKLRQQRSLTPIEEAYFETVESLTKFNPYIVSVLNEAPGESYEFMCNHFDNLSKNTWGDLENGSYVPQVHVGTGPDGLAYLGEQARINPSLASQTLVVDIGQQPGGPFAVPVGPAWELNSANTRGKGGAVLPDNPNGGEIKSVRAYGNPLRWYPGERKSGNDTREGSINTSVDYMPTPDSLSKNRFPTNEELQLMLAAQSSLLVKKICLETELVSVEPALENEKGDKKVILRKKFSDGSVEEKMIFTDSVINATGLGFPNLGFQLEGSRAEEILEEQNTEEFPIISDTLTAFKYLSSRREKCKTLPRTIAISGTGNSTDVLIEYLAELFNGDNPAVREVEKIYIIGEGVLSARPRYARIEEVKPRNGKGNLVEFVEQRVGDIEYSGSQDEEDPNRSQVNILNSSGETMRDDDGNIISVGAYIGATGFKSNTNEIYSAYLGSETGELPLENLTLPTNDEISVADYIASDPNILFTGTASKANFNKEKLAGLPEESRNALTRVGPENAVAIGFRSPDSQAACRIYLSEREKFDEGIFQGELNEVPISGLNSKWNISLDTTEYLPLDNIENINDMLTSIANYELVQSGIIPKESEVNIGGRIEYIFDKSQAQIFINNDGVSNEAKELISRIVTNPIFASYAQTAIKSRRGGKNSLEFNFSFKNRRINFKDTYVQTL